MKRHLLRESQGKHMTTTSNNIDASSQGEEVARQNEKHSRSLWEMSESEHFVQFYETDAFLLDSLSGFIDTGLAEGGACIVLATKAHRESLEERLKSHGLDLAAAQTQGDYISLDAAEALSKFMVNGLPDPERFALVFGDMIMRAAEGRHHVRVFGELVALLWADGKRAAAIRLEELWNDLGKLHPFSLFCAYPMHDFGSEVYEAEFTEICNRHSQVAPAWQPLWSPPMMRLLVKPWLASLPVGIARQSCCLAIAHKKP